MNSRSGLSPPTVFLGLFVTSALIIFAGLLVVIKNKNQAIQEIYAENERLAVEKKLQKARIEQLESLINLPNDPWLPDSIYFASQPVPLENWYVKKTLKERVSAIVNPAVHADLLITFRRMACWFPFIEKEAAAQGFFEDIKYLFVQESRLNKTARSKAGAMGISQFMRATAIEYGLRIDYYQIDERLLPEKAIPAAIRHMKDNYELFGGDIFLALAAYNAGAPRVRQAQIDQGDTTATFFELGYLAEETLLYPYAIIAWKIIDEHRDRYNMEYISKCPFEEYPEVAIVDTVIGEYVNVGRIASAYKIGYPEFAALNPHILSGRISPGEYTFRIPKYALNQ